MYRPSVLDIVKGMFKPWERYDDNFDVVMRWVVTVFWLGATLFTTTAYFWPGMSPWEGGIVLGVVVSVLVLCSWGVLYWILWLQWSLARKYVVRRAQDEDEKVLTGVKYRYGY